MSYNPGRRLKREAMRGFGWRTNRPASGRRRGLPRRVAEARAAQAAQVLNTRHGQAR